MSLSQRLIVAFFRLVTGALFRIDDAALEGVPQHGPMILVVNHINIFDIPLFYSHLQPRKMHGLVLASRWKNPILAWGLNATEMIPLVRGGTNLDNMRRSLDALKEGAFLAIAPEGTRSYHGQLQGGHQGVIPLALKSGVPLLPVCFYGHERYQEDFKRLRRGDFHFAVGRPFRLVLRGEELTRQVRQEIMNEVMYQLAAALPEVYRGKFTDLNSATTKYLEF